MDAEKLKSKLNKNINTMKKNYLIVGIIFVVFLLTFSCSKKEEKEEIIPLDFPSNIATSNNFALKIVLSWGEIVGAEGYYIYRTEANPSVSINPLEMTYQRIGSATGTGYEDIDVISGSYFYYRIASYEGSQISEMSTPIRGETKEITAEEAFTALAEYTNGKRYDANLAIEVPGIIIDVINENAQTGTDLVFLIDDTYSMWDDIEEVKNAIQTIIDILPSSTRLAAAVYNDANEDPTNWYNYTPFTTTYVTVKTFVNDIIVYGGGDYAESVYDGIYQTIDFLNWTSSSKRMMIVIGDAPPLEGHLTTYTLTEVINKCKSIGLIVNLYPILIKDSKGKTTN